MIGILFARNYIPINFSNNQPDTQRDTPLEKYIPATDIITIRPPSEGSFGYFKLHFPSTLVTNEDSVDCTSGEVIPKGSKVLVTGGDGFSGYGWGYVVGTSQTQFNSITIDDKDQAALCPGDSPVGFITIRIFKKADYLEMEKFGFEDDNTTYVGQEKISIGNITPQAQIYKKVWNQPKALSGKPATSYTSTVYHFYVREDYFVIEKPIYDETVNTIFDPKLLNDTVEYIFSHLEFQPV